MWPKTRPDRSPLSHNRRFSRPRRRKSYWTASLFPTRHGAGNAIGRHAAPPSAANDCKHFYSFSSSVSPTRRGAGNAIGRRVSGRFCLFFGLFGSHFDLISGLILASFGPYFASSCPASRLVVRQGSKTGLLGGLFFGRDTDAGTAG